MRSDATCGTPDFAADGGYKLDGRIATASDQGAPEFSRLSST